MYSTRVIGSERSTAMVRGKAGTPTTSTLTVAARRPKMEKDA